MPVFLASLSHLLVVGRRPIPDGLQCGPAASQRPLVQPCPGRETACGRSPDRDAAGGRL